MSINYSVEVKLTKSRRNYGDLKQCTLVDPFKHLPKLRPIIDTINTPYHDIGKFLTSLLNPLAQNEYFVKDSFVPAAKIIRYCLAILVMNILLYLLTSSRYSQTSR